MCLHGPEIVMERFWGKSMTNLKNIENLDELIKEAVYKMCQKDITL